MAVQMEEIGATDVAQWANGYYVYAEIWHERTVKDVLLKSWERAVHGELPTEPFGANTVKEVQGGIKISEGWFIPDGSLLQISEDHLEVVTPRNILVRFTRSKTPPPPLPITE